MRPERGTLLFDILHPRPPIPKQAGEVHAYNKLYGLRPDLEPVVGNYEVHGSLSDSTESLPLPPSLACHARHREVSGETPELS